MNPGDLEKYSVTERVRDFYDRHPYPPPVADLDAYRQQWQDEDRQRADFHLFWPSKSYSEDLHILVAGCGTSQAAKYAIRHPAAQVVGIDLSSTSVQQTLAFKKKYNLENLSVHQLPVERVGELEKTFDKIICTGVLHHLPDPQLGLHSLAQVLDPHGSIHLMVYAAYGRHGVHMLQEYAGLVGVGDSDEEITQFANTLMSLPADHPLAPILGSSPDFRTRAGLADALLNPQDRAYTVSEFMDLISDAGLKFGRWLRQAPYLPQCGRFSETPHFPRLDQLPLQDQYAALELLRGTMLRHSAVIYQENSYGVQQTVNLDHDRWHEYIPVITPGSTRSEEKLPPGASAVLINQDHTYMDLILPIDQTQIRIYDLIDGKIPIRQIINRVFSADATKQNETSTRDFFQRLWWYDHIVFNTATTTKTFHH
jgi:SAM-dependent methyltransferase